MTRLLPICKVCGFVIGTSYYMKELKKSHINSYGAFSCIFCEKQRSLNKTYEFHSLIENDVTIVITEFIDSEFIDLRD